jgi:hypothetical protein
MPERKYFGMGKVTDGEVLGKVRLGRVLLQTYFAGYRLSYLQLS